jgi:hypothetical protein
VLAGDVIGYIEVEAFDEGERLSRRGGWADVGNLRVAGQYRRRGVARAAEASPGWLDALGRGGRGRIAPAERGLGAVHQAVLRSFAAAGRVPEPALLDQAAASYGAAQVLAGLADGDFLCLDQAGQITAAYPFSAAATPHRVEIGGGACAYAMCAIDALGIAPMAGSRLVIRSADPSAGEPITVTVDGSGSQWRPATTVVFAGRAASGCAGPSAAICCEYMNFFASAETAAAWASAHPEITGVLGQDRAIGVGEQIFGQLLQ